MKLFEHLAKGIMAEAGIPTPQGKLCLTPAEAAAAAREFGPVAVKAQVLVGGRGKAGGVRLAETPAEAADAAQLILGMDLKGCKVESVWCEERLVIDRELYLAITVDPVARKPMVIASSQGGIAIEEVPERAIIKRHVPIQWGLQPFMARQVSRRLELPAPLAAAFVDVAVRLYGVFRDNDAELAEINPLAVVGGRLVAADARLNLDDEALYRQPNLPRLSELTPLEARVKELGLTLVQLEGDIAVMANGAGITMATLDVLQHFGGRPMNFLDAGGGSAAGPTGKALEILVSTHPKAVLVNIFGGITRCDEVARAILQVAGGRGFPMPLVARLVGTNEEQGVALLKEAGLEAFSSMAEAARRVVALAGEGGTVERGSDGLGHESYAGGYTGGV